MVDNTSLKDTKEGNSWKRISLGNCLGKKLNLKQSVEGENCLNFMIWFLLWTESSMMRWVCQLGHGPLLKKGYLNSKLDLNLSCAKDFPNMNSMVTWCIN